MRKYDLINNLPTVKPGQVGLNWFGRVASGFGSDTPLQVGSVHIMAHSVADNATVGFEKHLYYSGGGTGPPQPIFVKMLHLPAEAIPNNELVRGTLDAYGNYVIDWMFCEDTAN